MAGSDELDALVVKQLAKLGLSASAPPDPAQWQKFLSRISHHYRHADDDRRLLTRSLELSSSEMHELQSRLTDEHSRLHQMVTVISEGLRGFHSVVERMPRSASEDDVSEVTTTIHFAKSRLSRKFTELFEADGGSAWSRDEAEHIRREFLLLSDQLLELLQLTARRAGMQKDLEVARAVQHMLVPSGDTMERGPFRIAGFFQPAAQCGGDWWSTYDLTGQNVLTIIGDVTGHGVAPAIITGVAKASCDVALLLSHNQVRCAELLGMINRCICEAAQQTLFMTCVATVMDAEARTLTVANAGHPFPLIFRQSGEAPILQQRVQAGTPLGAVAESAYESASINLLPGDIVIWFTDGITESESKTGEQFGERRLRHVLQRVASRDPAEVRDSIVKELSAFCGDKVQDDDMTMVVACVS